MSANDAPKLTQNDETKISAIVQDIAQCQIHAEEEQLWLSMLHIINKAIADEHDNLMECLNHEGSMVALMQEALERVITDEAARVGRSPDDDEIRIETPAATTAFHALGAYTVAQEQFNRKRARADIEGLPITNQEDEDSSIAALNDLSTP